MKLVIGLLIITVFALHAAFAEGKLPETIKEAADAADGVVVGLATGFGEGGSFPYIEVKVLEVLKGKDPGPTLSAAFSQEAVAEVSMRAVQAAHGVVYIIPYRDSKDEHGRYAYAGPKFDSRQIIASPKNISVINPDSKIFETPTFEVAVKESDIVAVGKISYENFEDNEAGKKAFNLEDELHFSISEVIKGDIPENKITLGLSGRYFYWLFYEGGFTIKGAPLVSQESKLLLINKKGEKYHYAGPVFTSPYFQATPENISLARQLISGPGDLTWWIVGAAAALIALLAALLVSKVDYKYDRRRERFEIHGDNPYSDSGADASETKS